MVPCRVFQTQLLATKTIARILQKVRIQHPVKHIRAHTGVLKNIASVWLGAAVNSGIALILPLMLSRILEKSEFGQMSALLAMVALAAPLANFGVGTFWLRIFALNGQSALFYIRPSLIYVSITTLLTCTAFSAWIFFKFGFNDSIWLFQCLNTLIVCQVFVELVQTKYQVERQFRLIAFWQSIQQSLRLLIVGYAMWWQQDLAFVVFGYSLSALLISAFCLAGLCRAGGWQTPGQSMESTHGLKANPSITHIAGESWIYGLAALFYAIYFQIDIVLIEYLAGAEACAFYSAAFVTLNGIYLLPSVFYQKYLLPYLHRWAVDDPQKITRIYKTGSLLALCSGLVIMGLLMLCAKWLVLLLWGDQYAHTAGLLVILAISIPLKFLTMNMSGLLVTQNDMKRRLSGMAFVALINILLNLHYIPIYQAEAAAWITVACQLLLALIYWGINHYNQKSRIFN